VVRLPQQAAGLVWSARIRIGTRTLPLLFISAVAQSGTWTQTVCGTLIGVQQQTHVVICFRFGIWRHEWPIFFDQHTC